MAREAVVVVGFQVARVFGTEGGAYELHPDSASPVHGTCRNLLRRVQRQEPSCWFVNQRAGRRGRAVSSR